jgi:hypothetical protein
MPLLAEIDVYTAILYAIAGVILVGGVVGLYFISKKTPKGTVLGISVGIWFLSCYGTGIEIREVQVIVGLLRLLGTIGIVLGFIDFRLKRIPRKPVIFAEQKFNQGSTPDMRKRINKK